MADTPQQEYPAVISHYRLEAEIGRGGMGSVFRATDQRDGSAVAVKLLNRELQDDPMFRERFEREAHVGALLRSPYTVHLIDYGSAEGHLYLVMDFVEGQSVREVLRSGPLPASRALRIATQVARALEEADARGVVHRDIKPDNVMLGPNDSARVLDFGIARQAGSLTLTAAGGFIGSLPYASPEHATGTVDHRSDLYSLGATLYHMLAGRPPFSGDALEVLEHHRRTPMPEGPLEGVPAAAVTVVARCLEKDPARRYQTATELSVALSHAARLVDDEPSRPQGAVATEAAAAPTAEETLGAEATVAADTAPAAETALATEAARVDLAATEALSDVGPTLRLKS
ncbi:MAG: serine/threonine-protein kinase, partial [Chloroflexi bacterium]|nr:serine/threonine-protein kinase [Chloroflexota bacterium]